MSSRMDKYTSSDSTSRTSRNKRLYEDLYSDTSYNNSVVLDDSKEIDINKIKELIDKEKNNEKRKIVKPTTEDLYDDIDILKEEVNEKVYDINEVLKEAKSKRDILEEANEKRKTSKFKSHLDIEKELEKTRKVYDKLLQEETELLDIMNTLTNVPTNNGTDAYKDLTSEANKFKTGTVEVKNITKEMDKVEDKVDDDSTEYSTNTFMFDKKDFVTEDSLKEHMAGTNKFIKFLIFLLTIAVILGAYYVITTYILK